MTNQTNNHAALNDEIKQERLKKFEERQQSRLARYEELAEKAEQKSTAYATRSNDMASAIPFGQPILVGHHSEHRDRNYRSKIYNTMGKAVQEQKKADYYATKAATVGTGGISSDDPTAIDQLKEKLAKLQQLQETMKNANKAIKKHADNSARLKALLELGMNEKIAVKLLEPSCFGGLGFERFQLTNNNAEINRLKKRIAELEALENREAKKIESDLFKYSECKIENRCMFIFDGKPSEAIRNILKGNGFKWSPSRGAWVRQLNGNGIAASSRVIKQLKEI